VRKEVQYLVTVRRKQTAVEHTFDYLNYLVLAVICLAMIYPFLFLLSLSVTSSNVSALGLSIIPKSVTWANYAVVFENKYVLYGFISTLMRTLLGTSATLVITVCTAYVLSKRYYPHRTFWTMFIVFTMFFSGGLIPSYLLVKELGLMNSIWALILPGLINTFQMIIARNFFMALPDSIEESARIDGANDLRILVSIVLPVSMPIVATLTLWTAVHHWNAWFDSLIYIQDGQKQVLQVVMRRIVLEGTQDMMNMSLADSDVSSESVKAATIIVTTLPILLFYPFLQKHFVKGVMIGSLKG
jgi:putative aldouronate transport system permease protein